MDNSTVTIIGMVLSTVGGFFGKDMWAALTKTSEIKSDIKCAEKIALMEKDLSDEQMYSTNMVIGVDMLLTMLEDEFKDKTSHLNVISKVRKLMVRPEKVNINED